MQNPISFTVVNIKVPLGILCAGKPSLRWWFEMEIELCSVSLRSNPSMGKVCAFQMETCKIIVWEETLLKANE